MSGRSISIQRSLFSYLELSFSCPSCGKETVLSPGSFYQNCFCCSECQHLFPIKTDQRHHLFDLANVFDKDRELMQAGGFKVSISDHHLQEE